VREFHRLVLGSGAMPLPVLAENVEHFIASKRPPRP
jgi:uncharacterized protein (DUF885 family)